MQYTVHFELEGGSLVTETVEADSESKAEELALDNLDDRVRNHVVTYWTSEVPQPNELYAKLVDHMGHKVAIVAYGDNGHGVNPDNVSVECLDCNEIIIDANQDGE